MHLIVRSPCYRFTKSTVSFPDRVTSQPAQPCARARPSWKAQAQQEKIDYLLDAGPKTETIDYTAYDNDPFNRIFMSLFRSSLCQAAGGVDSQKPGFEGIVELTQRLNDPKINTPQETRERATRVLRSLFPSWFTSIVEICISRPFPELSARLNAWATSKSCTWLMGPLQVNDFEFEDGTIGYGQGVLAERCRYLEESQCASICHNSCKLPTQVQLRHRQVDFFKKEMGIDVTLEPNYEDFSCQFCFGKRPLPIEEDPVFKTPCFVQCPTKKRYSPSCSKLVK